MYIRFSSRNQGLCFHKGSAILAIVIILCIVTSLLAFSAAKISQVAVNTTTSNKTTLQAQHYANSKAELIQAERYSKLSSSLRAQIPGTDYYEEVIVGAETAYPTNSKIKQRICTINVYKGNESIPRSSFKLTRYSVSEGTYVPKGTILPWYGKISEIPEGFFLCNGKNGTPDLRDKFLVGAGNSYGLGDTGGEATHKLTVDELPKHFHQTCALFPEAGWDATNGGGEESSGGPMRLAVGDNIPYHYTNYWKAFTGYAGSDQPHENRPPYYALYYIMKVL